MQPPARFEGINRHLSRQLDSTGEAERGRDRYYVAERRKENIGI